MPGESKEKGRDRGRRSEEGRRGERKRGKKRWRREAKLYASSNTVHRENWWHWLYKILTEYNENKYSLQGVCRDPATFYSHPFYNTVMLVQLQGHLCPLSQLDCRLRKEKRKVSLSPTHLDKWSTSPALSRCLNSIAKKGARSLKQGKQIM